MILELVRYLLSLATRELRSGVRYHDVIAPYSHDTSHYNKLRGLPHDDLVDVGATRTRDETRSRDRQPAHRAAMHECEHGAGAGTGTGASEAGVSSLAFDSFSFASRSACFLAAACRSRAT